MKKKLNQKGKVFALFLATLFLAGTSMNAQDGSKIENPVGKGRIVFDADLSFGSIDLNNKDAFSTKTEVKSSNSDFSVGYAFIDNLVVSLRFSHTYNENSSVNQFFNSNEEGKGSTLSLNATYFFSQEKKLRPYLTVGYGLGSIDITSTVLITGSPAQTNNVKQNTRSFDFGGGLAYFINTHIGVGVFYTYSSLTYKDDDSNAFSADQDGNSGLFGVSLILSL